MQTKQYLNKKGTVVIKYVPGRVINNNKFVPALFFVPNFQQYYVHNKLRNDWSIIIIIIIIIGNNKDVYRITNKMKLTQIIHTAKSKNNHVVNPFYGYHDKTK